MLFGLGKFILLDRADQIVLPIVGLGIALVGNFVKYIIEVVNTIDNFPDICLLQCGDGRYL